MSVEKPPPIMVAELGGVVARARAGYPFVATPPDDASKPSLDDLRDEAVRNSCAVVVVAGNVAEIVDAVERGRFRVGVVVGQELVGIELIGKRVLLPARIKVSAADPARVVDAKPNRRCRRPNGYDETRRVAGLIPDNTLATNAGCVVDWEGIRGAEISSGLQKVVGCFCDGSPGSRHVEVGFLRPDLAESLIVRACAIVAGTGTIIIYAIRHGAGRNRHVDIEIEVVEIGVAVVVQREATKRGAIIPGSRLHVEIVDIVGACGRNSTGRL